MKVGKRRKHKRSRNIPGPDVPNQYELPPFNLREYTESNRQRIDHIFQVTTNTNTDMFSSFSRRK